MDSAFAKANPEAKIIRMGIGDVTRPLVPAVVEAMHKAVDDMSRAETFTVMARTLVMSFYARRSSGGTTPRAAFPSIWTKSSFPTAQNATLATFRKSFRRSASSR